MPYDAQTSANPNSGSHRRSGYRRIYGSNHWRDSDMRSWLNSDAEAGEVEWLCGNPPKDGYIMDYNGYGAYADKAGFLNGFKPDEAAAIKTVTQRSIVSHPEYTAGYIDAPGTDLPYNTDIGSVAEGYEGAHYENITDKVFLLDVKQLHTVYENLGSYYIGWNRSGTQWNYWLRTPVTDCNHDMRYVTCLLYTSRVNHPARQNHRIIPITINGSPWYLQYSPYVYYNCLLYTSRCV